MAMEKSKLNEKYFDEGFVGKECGAFEAVPKFAARLVKGEVTENLVRVGVMVRLVLERTRLQEPLPNWIQELPGLERVMNDRCLRAAGLFFAQGRDGAGYPARPGRESPPASWWINWTGEPPDGERITEAELFVEVQRYLADGMFTLQQVEVFARHPSILAALRTGAVDHLEHWLVAMTAVPAAEFLLNAAQHETVPGFTMKMLGKGRPAFLEAVTRIAREASVTELLAHVQAIKGEKKREAL